MNSLAPARLLHVLATALALLAARRAWAGSADGTWKLLPPPSERYLHSAVYDPVRDRMVVFGGFARAYDLTNEVWALTLSGSPRWEKLSAIGTPPSGRHFQSAIYDPVRDRIVIFGGLERSNPGYLNDVWALSLSGAPTWTQLLPAGTLPSTRAGHVAIYDATRDRMIVFGGYHSGLRGADSGFLNDLWALSLSGPAEWSQISPSGDLPAPRYEPSAILETAGDRIVLFGGFGDGIEMNDVWALPLGPHPKWKELLPAGALPSARQEHAAIYDPVEKRMVMFGGYDGGYRDDAWSLSLTGAPEWTQLDSTAAQPSRRTGHSAIYDPVRRRMVVYGGTPDGYLLLGDVWALSLSGTTSWENLTASVQPPEWRRDQTATYDPIRDRMIVFGGYSDLGGSLNDTWALSGDDYPVWSNLAPAGPLPPPRDEQTAIYDPMRDRLLVFGGMTDAGTQTNDVWALSLAGMPAWTQLHPQGAAPAVRAYHSAIYDAPRDRMLVFGGISGDIAVRDLWALSLSDPPTWTQLFPLGTPPSARFDHSAIYDPNGDRMIVFGGLAAYFFGSYPVNETWQLSLAGTPTWSQLPTIGTPPSPRGEHTAILSILGYRMVVCGGLLDLGGPDANDVWELTLGVTPTWTQLFPGGAAAPTFAEHSAIFDPIRNRMKVFAGNQLWVLDWGPPPSVSVPLPGGEAAVRQLAAYPNPSHSQVTIAFGLARSGQVSLRVLDISGRVVATIVNGVLPEGLQTVRWDWRTDTGVHAEPGLYFCELLADGRRATHRLVLMH